MSISGMKCAQCKRTHRHDEDGVKPLEVCHSSRHNEMRCLTCHFMPTKDEKQPMEQTR